MNDSPKIARPTTTGDDGRPSDSCHEDVKRMIRLIEDERHLCALSLHGSIIQRLESSDAPSSPPRHNKMRLRRSMSTKHRMEKAQDTEDATKLLASHTQTLQNLEERCRLFKKAQHNLNVGDDWTLAQTLFGVTTHYRREEDGSLSIKLEGSLKDVPLFDQVAVLREVDLHYRWAPFVSSSLTIAHLDKLDTIGWFVVGLPSFGLMRDSCFRAIGCDSIYEDGSILLVAQGIADKPKDGAKKKALQRSNGSSHEKETATTTQQSHSGDAEFEYLSKDPRLQELDLPDPPTRMGSGRMTLRTFQAIIHVESPTEAKTCLVANIDPNLPLIPQSLLDFLMKKMCGVLLAKLQSAAKKVSKDPVNNPHASKMRQEEDFYKGWLMPKFESVCKIRGWTMPPSSFDLTDQQLELAEKADEKMWKGKTAKTIKFYHSLSEDKLEEFLEPNNSSGGSEPNFVGQGKTGPRLRTVSNDSDDMSDISRNSSSTFSSIWQKNPLTVYLRDVEEKTQLRKAREIERSRERAANRLKPKELDLDSRSRLQELRAARGRRKLGMMAGKRAIIPLDATKSQRKVIKSHYKGDWSTALTNHGFFTRLLVICGLVASLFAVLYLDTVFEQFMSNRHGTWGMGRKRDIATVLYMGLSAVVHFNLCYVALMYAFSALQLGTIAGREATRFYSENVHLIVVVFTGSLVLLGMLKAVFNVLFRWAVWQAASLVGSPQISAVSSGIALLVPESLESSVETIGSLIDTVAGTCRSGYAFIVTFVAALSSLLKSVILDSNIVGRSVTKMFLTSLQPFAIVANFWIGFLDESVGHYEGRPHAMAWREDAYATTRILLTYSAVFLLIVLVLFNVLATMARTSTEQVDVDGLQSIDGSEHSPPSLTKSDTPPLLQPSSSDASPPSRLASSPHSDSRSRKYTRSLSPNFDTIEEASEEGDARAPPGETGRPRSEATPKKKKRAFGLFRSRKQTTSRGGGTKQVLTKSKNAASM